jgi:RHS repeat-associated protein
MVSRRQYQYTAFDEPRTLTKADGTTRIFSYDPLGRLEGILDADGETTWIYDGAGPNEIGRLVEMISPATTQNPSGQRVRYSYEPPTPGRNSGFVKSITHLLDSQPALVTSFDYDSASRLERIHYPAADGAPFAIRYSYDGPFMSAVHDVSGGSEALIWSLVATDQGYRIADEAFGQGAATHYDYEPLTGRLSSILTTQGANVVQSLAYNYYPNGSLHNKASAGVNDELTYDELNRLASRTRAANGVPPEVEAWTYDLRGNIATSSVGTHTYDPARPHLLSEAGNHSFTYDANGNTQSRTGAQVPGAIQVIAYKAFDLPRRIGSVQPGNVSITDFDYDADANRVVKREPSGRTTYYAGDLYREVIPPSGSPEHRYAIFAAGRQVAEVARGPSGDATYYLHDDLQGSITAVTDATQAHTQAFAPFGAPTGTTASATGIIAGFTAHEMDVDLGLINMRGRIYDPTFGRFLTRDPIVQAPFWS